jgi:hypothetical protein
MLHTTAHCYHQNLVRLHGKRRASDLTSDMAYEHCCGKHSLSGSIALPCTGASGLKHAPWTYLLRLRWSPVPASKYVASHPARSATPVTQAHLYIVLWRGKLIKCLEVDADRVCRMIAVPRPSDSDLLWAIATESEM